MALGRLGDPLDGRRACWSRPTTPRASCAAFLSFVPWGDDRPLAGPDAPRPDADNGLVELMIASLAGHAATYGVGPVSLNFAMFREAFERGAEVGAGPGRPALAPRACCWPAGTGSWSRSTARTRSTSRTGSRATSATSSPPTCPGSASRPAARRGSSPRRRSPLLRRKGRGGGPPRVGAAERAAAVLALIPPAPDLVAEARLARPPARADAGAPREARPDPRRGHRPVPGHRAPHPHPRRGPRAGRHGDLPPDTETATTVVGRRPGAAQARHGAPRLRHPARRQRRPPGDGRRPAPRPADAVVLGARRSTSATTWASPARWSRRRQRRADGARGLRAC